MTFSRRDFLMIMGVSATVAARPLAVLAKPPAGITFKGIAPGFTDQLVTAPGLDWRLLLSAGDAMGNGLRFGDGNDYLQFFPLSGPNHGVLWVNHEYYNPLFFTSPERTPANIKQEMDLVGGSLVEIRKGKGGWALVQDSPYNRRLHGHSMIPFAGGRTIRGQTEAIGTFAGCAGGRTPWNTVLSCEENYDMYYGERDRQTGERKPSTWYGWEKVNDCPPEHYGWVVEIDPMTGAAKKHVSLGRFAHECATVRLAKDQRPVVYMGDDANDQYIYKFIASRPGQLEEGTLYVADTDKGRWIPMVHSDKRLKDAFKDQVEIWTYCRDAAKLLGATKQDRPEDIEIDPFNGDVVIALTNNKPAGRPMGRILKLMEAGNDPLALSFTTKTFLEGGEQGGFACPDNLAFDGRGNLWFTTDMSGDSMHKGVLQNFGNNGLFVVMRTGPQAGIPVQVASAPTDAEFTGPLFSPDGKTLFLSVQHPGEQSKDKTNLTSRWPSGKGLPRASVVTLQGPLLEKITLGA